MIKFLDQFNKVYTMLYFVSHLLYSINIVFINNNVFNITYVSSQ